MTPWFVLQDEDDTQHGYTVVDSSFCRLDSSTPAFAVQFDIDHRRTFNGDGKAPLIERLAFCFGRAEWEALKAFIDQHLSQESAYVSDHTLKTK